MTVFGLLKTPNDVEQAVEVALRKWMPTYIKAVGKQNDLNLAPIASYTVVSEYAKFPEKGHPAIVIESAGLSEDPDEDGEGNLTGTYAVQVSIVTHGPEAVATRTMALAYAAAIVAALMQHKTLTSDVSVKRYLDAAFTGANVERRRTEIAVGTSFLVEHENFLNVGEGPIEPEPEDDDWPTVETVETDVERKDS